MITNERQYRITSSQLERIKAAISSFDLENTAKQVGFKVLAEAELGALISEYDVLKSQLDEYKKLQSGSITTLEAASLNELPLILIKARIARRLSQRQLAEILGLKEQQIQRYEADEYATANLTRLKEIACALDLNISETADFKPPSPQPPQTTNGTLNWDLFPIKEMYLRGWLDKLEPGTLEDVKNNAAFLARKFVNNATNNNSAMLLRHRVRSNASLDAYSLHAWQCRLLSIAQSSPLPNPFSRKNMTKRWFENLIKLSASDEGVASAKDYLEESGIHLIIEPHLPQTYLDGAALITSRGSPIVGLTLRYDRLDNFWFVLFHELVHIRHHLRKGEVDEIYDNLSDTPTDDIEKETDSIANELLIPASRWETALAKFTRSPTAVIELANELQIHPAIIAGRIRFESDDYRILNDLVGNGKVRKFFPETH